MRLASWTWGGQPQAGTVSADGRELTPLAATDPCTVRTTPACVPPSPTT